MFPVDTAFKLNIDWVENMSVVSFLISGDSTLRVLLENCRRKTKCHAAVSLCPSLSQEEARGNIHPCSDARQLDAMKFIAELLVTYFTLTHSTPASSAPQKNKSLSHCVPAG